jgi:hypothetical protein
MALDRVVTILTPITIHGISDMSVRFIGCPDWAYQHGAARLNTLNPEAFTQLRFTGNPGQ